MRIFCDLRSSFPSPAGTKKNTKQWTKCPLVLYVKPSNERFIIPLQRKNCYLQLASIFLVRVFKNVLIPSVRMTLTMSKMFTRIICQTIEWDVNYSTAKRKKIHMYILFWLLFSGKSIQNILRFSQSSSFWIWRYSPCWKPVKPGHYSVLWPRILRVLLTLHGKRHHSGIIIPFIASIFFTNVKCTYLK